MIDTSPNAPAAVILEGLRNLVANSATFQNAVGVNDYQDAKDHIFLVEHSPVLWPFALCFCDPSGWRYTPKVTGIPHYIGCIRLQMETPVEPTDEKWYQIHNFFGGIAQDISVLVDHRFGAVNDATLRPNMIEWDEPWCRSRKTNELDYWTGTLKLTFDNRRK